MEQIMQFLSAGNVGSSDPLWDGSQYVNPPEEQETEEQEIEEQETEEVQVVQGTGKSKGRQCRTRNFSEKEDILLCESWLEVSLDAAQSNEQHRSTYWERIHEYYHKHKTFDSERSVKSVTSQWGTILECTNRFCGCYTQISNWNQSGKNEEDRIQDACAMYKEVDPLHRSFNLKHCWHVLRHEQKWNDWCAQKKQKVAGHASLGNTPGTDESHHVEEGECHTSPRKDARPIGKKKAKEQQRQGKNSGSPLGTIYRETMETMWTKKQESEDLKEKKRKDRDDMFFALEQQRIDDKRAMEQRKLEENRALEQKKIDEQMALEKKKHKEKMAMEKKKHDEKMALEKKRLELRERELNDEVMNKDLSRMSEIQQEYWKQSQQEVLVKRFGGKRTC